MIWLAAIPHMPHIFCSTFEHVRISKLVIANYDNEENAINAINKKNLLFSPLTNTYQLFECETCCLDIFH